MRLREQRSTQRHLSGIFWRKRLVEGPEGLPPCSFVILEGRASVGVELPFWPYPSNNTLSLQEDRMRMVQPGFEAGRESEEHFESLASYAPLRGQQSNQGHGGHKGHQGHWGQPGSQGQPGLPGPAGSLGVEAGQQEEHSEIPACCPPLPSSSHTSLSA